MTECPACICLFVDDSALRKEIEARLIDWGYRVCVATAGGAVGISRIVGVEPDLVLLDIGLAARHDIAETLGHLRERGDPALVLLGAGGDGGPMRGALALNPLGYVAKSATGPELDAALQVALFRRDAERGLREANTALETKNRARADELAASEARLRYLLTACPVTTYCATGPDGFAFDFMAPNIISKLGYSSEFLIANAGFWRSIIHPDDLPGVLAGRSMPAAEGEVRIQRYRCRRSDGTWRWLRDDYVMQNGLHGTSFGILGALFDVTERHVADQARSLGEARLKDAQRIAKLGYWSFDRSADIATWSDGTYEIFGREPTSPAPNRERYLTEIVLPEDEAAARRMFFTDNADEKSKNIDHRFRRPDGTVGWVHLEGRAEYDEAGEFVKIHGTVQDVTELKRSEIALADLNATLESRIEQRTAALSDSENRFRVLFEQAAVGVVEVDTATGRPIQFNRKFSEIVGYELQELLGRGFHTITHPEDRAADRLYADKLRGGEFSEFTREKRLIRKDGSVVWVSSASAPLWTPGEPPSRHISVVSDITDRKNAEEELRKNDALLSEAQQTARLGSWELDLASNKLTWSDEIFRIFGIDKSRFGASYEYFLAAIHPDDREAVNKAYTDSVAGRVPYEIVHRLVMDDGRIKWVEERGRTWYDEAGRPLRSTGTVQDISARKQLEEAMRAISTELVVLEGKPYFEAVARKLGGLLVADIVFITRFDRAASGELETVVLIEDGRVVPNLRYNLTGKPCADVIRGVPYMVEKDVVRLYPADTFLAKRKIEAYAAVPLIENSGRIIGHLGIMRRRPIQNREMVPTILNMFAVAVAAAIVRERSRREYRDLFEFAPDGLVLSDQDGRIVLVNQQVEAIFGWTRSDLIGQNLEVLIPPNLRHAHVGLREGFVKSPKRRRMAVERGMLRAQRKDGSVIPVEIDLAPVETDDGIMFAAAIRDITLRKRLEDQLAQSTKMEALGKLTGGMAHDFNNYLGVIMGSLDLLKETANVSPGQTELIDMALNGAERSAELTRSLLAFSRQQPLDPRVTDINGRLKSVAGMLRRTLGEDIELKTTPSADLWTAKIDGAQLDSCIVNLANNARDAMPRGGSLLIETRNAHLDAEFARSHAGAAAGDYVLIEVSDTGEGMAPEIVSRVFDPFFTTKRPGHGTGLGLSMVYGFVKQSGGYINIHSEPGKGTTVRLYLPRAEMDDAGAEARASTVARPDDRATETILVVEDNEDVRDTANAQLSSLGYRVIQAQNAETAMLILEAGEPRIDLLFTDVVMPGPLDGFALAAVAAERRPGIKILMTSGFPGDTSRGGGKMDATPLLVKPYRRAELAQAIRSALGGRDHESASR